MVPVIGSSRFINGGRKRFGIAGATAAALGIVVTGAALIAPASGAWFFDEKTGHTSIATTALGITFLNPDDSSVQTVDVPFDTISPGETKTQSIRIKNTGSIPGTLKLSMGNFAVNSPAMLDRSLLVYRVDGVAAMTPMSETGIVELGTVAPNEIKTIELSAELSQAAGNEWQSATVTSSIAVSLAQIH